MIAVPATSLTVFLDFLCHKLLFCCTFCIVQSCLFLIFRPMLRLFDRKQDNILFCPLFFLSKNAPTILREHTQEYVWESEFLNSFTFTLYNSILWHSMTFTDIYRHFKTYSRFRIFPQTLLVLRCKFLLCVFLYIRFHLLFQIESYLSQMPYKGFYSA